MKDSKWAGDYQRLWTYCMRLPETVDILHEITRDCGHTAQDYQRLRTYCTKLPETADILHWGEGYLTYGCNKLQCPRTDISHTDIIHCMSLY